jgi:branched-chain amino acid aminotransferase
MSASADVDLGIVSWVDGALVPAGQAAIRPEDRGLVGDGVFEAMKVLDGVPFALRRHLERLVASATPLGLRIDLEQVRDAVAAVLATDAGRQPRCWLRITVTGGPARMGKGERSIAPTVMAAVAPMPAWTSNATVAVLPWRRNERGATTGLKTISYIENGIGLRHANAMGADEGIFANTVGNLCEGTGTNVFVVRDDRIVTPPLSAGCLAGVTRQLLLEWHPDVVEADLPMEHLVTCDEAFLTSTSRDVHPIGSLDGRVLAGAPGPLTRAAMACFAQQASRSIDP